MEVPSSKCNEEVTGSVDGSSVPDAGWRPETSLLATLAEQVIRHSCEWAEDWAQMSELCKQVTDTNDQFNFLHFTVGLYKQVLLTVNLYHHFELTHYRDYIMHQDRNFTWQAVYTYDIQFRVKCAQSSLPLTSMAHGLVATILDVTTVKSSAQKCFRCNGYNHLIDSFSCFLAASHEMAKLKGG